MVKKIIVLLLLTFGLFGFSYANELNDYITKNFEYIFLKDDSFYRLKEYSTNKNNKIYVLGYISYYSITGLEQLKNMINFQVISPSNTFFVFKSNGEVQAISKSENKIKNNLCQAIEKYKFKLLMNHEDSLVIQNYTNKLFGGGVDDIICYKYGEHIIMPNNSIYNQDFVYLVNNMQDVYLQMKSIPIINKYSDKKMNILYSIYKYIINNTKYDYNVLSNYSSYKNNHSPWYVSSFFKKSNIVCDGYVKTFLFILRYLGISGERIVGDLQPIDDSPLNVEGFLHSWVKIGDRYFDLTFDDSDDEESFNYFNQSKSCTNINHYTTGWVKFNTYNERYDYLIKNGENFLKECPFALKNALYNDDKLIDFIKFALNNYTFNTNITFLCEIFGECDLSFKTKEDILSKLKLYEISYSSALGNKKYYLKTELGGFQIKENLLGTTVIIDSGGDSSIEIIKKTQEVKIERNYELNQNDRNNIGLLMKLINEKLKKLNISQRDKYYNALVIQVKKVMQREGISDKKYVLLEYLLSRLYSRK